jgi:Tol biopolymer transport system component
MNPDGSGQIRLTERNETYDYFPAWSPDGKSVLFCSNAKGHYSYEGDWGLYLVDVDTKKTTLLLDTPGRDVFPDWH